VLFLLFFVFLEVIPVYLRASVGDIFPAIFAGFLQLIITVNKENSVASINIMGLKDTSLGIALACVPANIVDIVIGTIPKDTISPNISPIGIPIKESLNTCPLTISFICFGDVPIVFNNP